MTNEGASLAAMALYARADNVQALSQLLSPLVLEKQTTASVHVGPAGLTVHTSQGKSVMATARLDASLFQEWRVLSEALPGGSVFAVSLSTLVGVLQIFGPVLSTTVRLAWKGYGSDLLVVLHENAMRTECSLRTLEADESADDGTALFHSCPVTARLTLASESLREAFAELDWESPYVQLRLAPSVFCLSTDGSAGSCAVDWAADSPLLDSYECGATQSHTYRLKLLQPCVRALSSSSKTQIQVNSEGVLLVQHIIKGLHSAASVVDFVFVPSMGPSDDVVAGEATGGGGGLLPMDQQD